MAIALTQGMSVLKLAARNAAQILVAAVALFSVACAGEERQPTYASTDVDADPVTTVGQPAQCEAGAVQSCTIWLGQHGDLANCIHGMDVCTTDGWSGCVDEETLAENPELYGELTADAS
jgi:hypothetical protein